MRRGKATVKNKTKSQQLSLVICVSRQTLSCFSVSPQQSVMSTVNSTFRCVAFICFFLFQVIVEHSHSRITPACRQSNIGLHQPEAHDKPGGWGGGASHSSPINNRACMVLWCLRRLRLEHPISKATKPTQPVTVDYPPSIHTTPPLSHHMLVFSAILFTFLLANYLPLSPLCLGAGCSLIGGISAIL